MVRSVAGVVLLVMATGLVAAGIAFVFARRRQIGRVDPPERVLNVYVSHRTPYGLNHLTGTIINPPTLHAPVSGRACSVWELSLFSVRYVDDGPCIEPLWVTGQCADLVIEYDERRDFAGVTRTRTMRRPQPGGRVRIPGRHVSVVFPRLSPESLPLPGISWLPDSRGYRPPDSGLLREVGAPADLVAQVQAQPRAFGVTVGSVSTGEVVSLGQAPLAPPTQVPDPDQPFQLFPIGQRRVVGPGVGRRGPVCLVVALVIGLVGVALVALS